MSDYYNKYNKAELKRLIKEKEKTIEAQKKPRLADGRINPDYKGKPSPVVKDQLKKAKDNFTKRFGADGNKNRPDYKKAALLKAKGGGGSRGEDGIIRGLGSDLDPKELVKSMKTSMDFRKGGMVLSTTDNRKNK
jgi:hypothetical protein